jgi:zinc protease
MRKISSIFLFLFILSGFALAADIPDMFPFPVESYKLPNGMEVVLIKYGTDGTVIDMLVVDTGSRYEKKPDEIEYTHLMEHLMFRGSKNYTVADVNKIYTKYGVYDQGFTASDFTCYYRIFPKDAMEDLTKIMADRLENLSFTEDEYKAETGAVLVNIRDIIRHHGVDSIRNSIR